MLMVLLISNISQYAILLYIYVVIEQCSQRFLCLAVLCTQNAGYFTKYLDTILYTGRIFLTNQRELNFNTCDCKDISAFNTIRD